MSFRFLAMLAVLGSFFLIGVGVSQAQPGHENPGHPKLGHLIVTTADEEQTLPPGQAKKAVAKACPPGTAKLDIDAIRAAFPAAVEVCPGVTVRSQVAGESTTTTTVVPPS